MLVNTLVASRVPSQRNTQLPYQLSGCVSYRVLPPGWRIARRASESRFRRWRIAPGQFINRAESIDCGDMEDGWRDGQPGNVEDETEVLFHDLPPPGVSRLDARTTTAVE
jgi:hypothetical protein